MSEKKGNSIDDDVRLALSLQKCSKPIGEPPSEEELVQLSEASLSDTRHKEVLSHLAANPQLRERWAAGLELVDWLSDSPAAEEKIAAQPCIEPEPKLNRFIKQIKAIFVDYLSPQHTAWGGATIAAVAAVFFMMPSSQSSKVSDIYEIWQPILANGADAQHSDIRFRGAVLDVPDSHDLQALLLGLEQGLADLGTWAYLSGIKLPSLEAIDQKVAKQYPLEISLGRLLALSSQACLLKEPDPDLIQAIQNTLPELISNTRFGQQAQSSPQSSSGELAVCEVTTQLLNALRD